MFMDIEVLEDSCQMGNRVSCEGERGTVRYVGSVPPTAGQWLGVEWDNATRGKHDGSHQGVRYFSCRHPHGGSFIRPKKASNGVDFMTALRKRYEREIQQHLKEKVTVSSKIVEVEGLEDRRLENITTVSLRMCEVSNPGLENEIRKTIPGVESLDMNGNLLSSWDDVITIIKQMECLRELHLSHNRLCMPSKPLSSFFTFYKLKILSLANCVITWPQLLECSLMWPQLEELYVSSNEITELQRPFNVLQCLTTLDLSENLLIEESLQRISGLLRLEKLILSNTGISELRFDDVTIGFKTEMFPELKILYLNNNRISEWWVINELEKLKSLKELSCHSNPFLSSARNPQTAQQLIIAKVGQLVSLNRSQILPEDRRGAELDYCKMFASKWLESGGHREPQLSHPSGQFTTQHPRFQHLIEKYGAPEEGELKKEEPFALKNQLVGITFVCPDEVDRLPITKKLPDSMIIQKVKGLLFRLLKIGAAELKLSYSSSKMEGKEIEMNSDLKSLQFYSVEDGDKILVRWSYQLEGDYNAM